VHHAPFDSAQFRRVLGHFPTGVTVVTAMTDAGPVGMTIGSFFSVSLDPPLVAFCAAHSSSTYPNLKPVGSFCVNILAEDQEDICRRVASKEPDKWEGLGWKEAGTGSPVLDGVLAWIDCDLDVIHEAGDHDIVVGRVRELDVAREGGPLVFFRGGYGSFSV
jgi:flavin reductase (DIM6/NTAB) family NADH-FMN oxidoreductase RutF